MMASTINLLCFEVLVLALCVQSSNWTTSDSSTRVLSIIELPENSVLPGGILELLDVDVFGTALYWRKSFNSSEYEFAIPLPIGVRSLALFRSHIYFVADGEPHSQNNLHRILDFKLFGGYLFWMEARLNQEAQCNITQLQPGFNFQHPFKQQTSSIPTTSDVCSIPIDPLFSEDRLSIARDKIIRNGMLYFAEAYNKFRLLYKDSDLAETTKYWKTWLPFASEPQRYLSINFHSNEKLDFLYAIQPNYKVVALDYSWNAATPIIAYNKDLHWRSLTSFYVSNDFIIVGLGLDGSVYVTSTYFHVTVKVDTPPLTFTEIDFIANNFIGKDEQNQLHYSTDFIKDSILDHIPCDHQSVVTSGGCLTYYDPETRMNVREMNGACAALGGRYRSDLSEIAHHTTMKTADKYWNHHENGRDYLFSRHLATHSEAESICSTFSSSTTTVSHLAVIGSDKLKEYLKNVIKQRANDSKFSSVGVDIWVGAYSDWLGDWLWLDGSKIPFVQRHDVTTAVPTTSSTTDLPLLPETTATTGFETTTGSFVQKECVMLQKMPGSLNLTLVVANCNEKKFFVCEYYNFLSEEYNNYNISFAIPYPGFDDRPSVFYFGEIFTQNASSICQKYCNSEAENGCTAWTYFASGGIDTLSLWHAPFVVTSIYLGRNGALSNHCYGTNIQTNANFTSFLRPQNLQYSGRRKVSKASTFVGDPVSFIYNTTVDLAIESIYNLGCWKDNSSHVIPILEGKHNILDGTGNRVNAFEKCNTAAKLMGLPVFSLQGGLCFGSNETGDFYKKNGESSDCANNGLGGTLSNQVYRIRNKGFTIGGCTTVVVRAQCGADGINEADCISKGCCYNNSGLINCFYKLLPATVDLFSLGCWKDPPVGISRTIPIMTSTYLDGQDPIEKCLISAIMSGFEVFSLDGSGNCFSSSNALTSYKTMVPASDCTSDGLGGIASQQVYHTPINHADNWERLTDLGCWVDMGYKRAIPSLEGITASLSDHFKERTEAFEKCKNAVKLFRYTVFALQNGGRCRSSDTAHETYALHGKSTKCSSDGLGGPLALHVYQIRMTDRWERILSLGCWRNDVNNEFNRLEGTIPGLSDSSRSRTDPYKTCKDAVKAVGYSIFGLANHGKCFGSLTADGTYMKFGKSTNCLSNRLGGPYAFQVYQIRMTGLTIEYGRGPFTLRSLTDLTRSVFADPMGVLGSKQYISQPYYITEPGLSDTFGSVSFKLGTKEKSFILAINGSTLAVHNYENTLDYKLAASFLRTEVAGEVNVYTYESVKYPSSYIYFNASSNTIHFHYENTQNGCKFKEIYLHDDCDSRPQFRQNCAAGGTTRDQCFSLGCCWDPLDHYPWCFKRKPSGSMFTEDGWLKNPYTSYQYATIRIGPAGSMEAFRWQCQAEGGELAYVGINQENSYKYIYDLILHGELAYRNIWIGIIEQNNVFMGLDGTVGWNDFHYTQPNGIAEPCVYIARAQKEWHDVQCHASLTVGLCQRLDDNCDINPLQRVQCHPHIPFTASRFDCISHGCCYVEPINGTKMCYKKNKESLKYRDISWWASPNNSYEYAVVGSGFMDYTQAKELCWERGADLAYTDLFNIPVYSYLWAYVLSSPTAYLYWVGIIKNESNYIGLDGSNGSISWEPSHPQGLGCVVVNSGSKKWMNLPCSQTYPERALCQRLKAPQKAAEPTNTRFVCETPLPSMCDKYGHRCNKYANCEGNQTRYNCVCIAGYTGDGENCYKLEQCPEGWTLSETGCYLLKVNSRLSFYEAELECQTLGSHLASVHSTEEMDFIRQLVQVQGNVMVWLGLRLSNSATSSGDCVWSDGSNCVYNFQTSNPTSVNVNRECLTYRSDLDAWQLEQCAVRMQNQGLLPGFICEIDITRPKSLHVKITSQSWAVYPGFAEMSINGQKMDWESADEAKMEKGCIHLATLNAVGKPIFVDSICTEEGDNLDQKLMDFATTHKAEDKVAYIAVATGGQFKPRKWNMFVDKMNGVGIDLYKQNSGSNYKAQIKDSDFYLPAEKSHIFQCSDSTCMNCWGPVVFSRDGSPACRVYQGNSMDEYKAYKTLPHNQQYTATTVGWVDAINQRRVRFRSNTMSEVGETSTLQCPWTTTNLASMGFNVEIKNGLSSPPHSNATCVQPPCVHQISCESADLPEQIDPSYKQTFDSYILFCQRYKSTGSFKCWINQPSHMFGGPNVAEVTIPVQASTAPLLCTFDDLIHLGSIPFEFGTTLSIETLAWKPTNWKWSGNRFPVIISGVRDRAIRISGEEAKTAGNLCWGKLDSDRCTDGFTLSLWLRVMKFPQSNSMFVLNSGGLDSSSTCSGMGIYFTDIDQDLHIIVKVLNQTWHGQIPFQLKKWTHIFMTWNSSTYLQVTTDLLILHAPINSTDSMLEISNGTTSCNSELVIGGQSTSGIFDIDELLFFDQVLSQNDFILASAPSLPIRHNFFGSNPSVEHLAPIIFAGGTSCVENTIDYHRGCADYGNTCPGNPLLCKLGFTLAFHLEFQSKPGASNSKKYLLVSNLPTTDSSISSLGFKIEAYKSGNADLPWKVSFRHTLTANREYQSNEMSWMMATETKYMFWLQMDTDYKWVFCMQFPTNCIKDDDNTLSSNPTTDPYTELMVGPVILTHYSGGTIGSSQYDGAKLTDVWFIEQALDLSVVADEVRPTHPPLHWIVHSKTNYSTKQGHNFMLKGNIDRLNPHRYTGPISSRYGIGNYKSLLNTSALESSAGWLLLDTTGITCLHDIDNCEDGFTIQFWFNLFDCALLDMENNDECVFISNGGHGVPLSRGFTFSRIIPDQYFQVVVSTSKKFWRIKFTANLKNEYNLIRISWEKDTGLSLFLNEAPTARTSQWEEVEMIPEDNDRGSSAVIFDPFTSMTIGRRNDDPSGFSSFTIADIHFWDGLVEGTTFKLLGDICNEGWTQIGGMCYKLDGSHSSYQDAASLCESQGASLPVVTSLSMFEYFGDIFGGNTPLYWLDVTAVGSEMRWNFIQRSVSSMNFDAFTHLGAVDGSSKFFANSGLLGSPAFLWSYEQTATAGVICQRPLVKDPFYKGCFDFDNDLSQHEMVHTHDFISATYADVGNSIGTYSLPQACMNACYRKYNSSVVGLASWKCACMEPDFTKSQLQSLTALEKADCSSSTFLESDSKMQRGYETLNFPLFSQKHLTYNAGDFCGSTEWGGGFMCGVNLLGQQRASVYVSGAFDNPKIVPTVFPITWFEFTADPTDFIIDVNRPLTIRVSSLQCLNYKNPSGVCNEEKIKFSISFGDGSVYENFYNATTLVTTVFIHSYNTSGSKMIEMNARNTARYTAYTRDLKIIVLQEIEKVELYSVEVDVVQPGQLAVIRTIGLSGTYMQCTWNYGDESPSETLVLDQLPIPQTYHRYQTEGEFNLSVRCWNRLQIRTVHTLAVVHKLIHGIVSPTDAVVEYGQPYVHPWNVIQGSHIDCQVFFGNLSLPEVTKEYFNDPQNSNEEMMYFDRSSNQGSARIPPQLYVIDPGSENQCLLPGEATTYTLLVSCYNGVTDPSPSVATYVAFEVPIVGFTLRKLKDIVQINEEVCMEANITSGSNIILSWTFNNQDHPEHDVVEYCGEDECRTRVACLTYERKGLYFISVEATNALGVSSQQLDMSVLVPITNLELSINPAIVPYENTTFWLSHRTPTPTGHVSVDFGDETPILILDLILNEATNQMMFVHRYASVQIHTITIHAYNNVSSLNLTDDLQIGLNIKGHSLLLVSPSRYLRSEMEDVVLQSTVLVGSELLYKIDFGDSSPALMFGENSTRTTPLDIDIHEIRYRYLTPGNYTVSMEVWNVFDRYSINLGDTLIVQNPLHSGIFNLTVVAVPPIAYPPGEVSLKAKLALTGSGTVPNGWANNVHSTWKFPGREGSSQTQYYYGNHELDIFPVAFKCSRENVGDNLVKAQLYNLVSTLSLSYFFKVMETVGEIALAISNLEQNKEMIVTVTDTTTVDVSVHHTILFILSIDKGSHLSYTVKFGDNSVSKLASPVLFGVDLDANFKHGYSKAGLYSIEITADNDVSERTKIFTSVVKVYDPVTAVTLNVEYIDIDEELNEVDIFEESSEIYALVYGKPGFDESYQQRRALKLVAGLYNGSNVNMIWQFNNIGVSVHFDYNENGYHTAYVLKSSGEVHLLTDNTVKTDTVHIKRLRKLTIPEVTFLGSNIASKLNQFNYLWETTLLVRFLKSGSYAINVTAANPVSKTWKMKRLNVISVIKDLAFIDAEPPVANKTSNISFSVKQIGTDSCFLVDPGDSSGLTSFGLTGGCTSDPRIDPDRFFLITEDRSIFSGRNFSYYNVSAGKLADGTVTLNLTMEHVYTQPAFITIKINGFNLVSSVEISLDITVTKIVCDFPTVSIEKLPENSLTNPQRIFSFLQFRSFSSISIDCSLTSRTVITWKAYSIVHKTSLELTNPDTQTEESDEFVELHQSARKFETPTVKFKEMLGVSFTSKSEDVTFKPRFFKVGPHLVCINVAMYQVAGIVSSDCIYLEVILPPLVAGITFGIRRAVSHGTVVEMDAGSASYDPSEESLLDASNPNITSASSNFTYSWSCPMKIAGSVNESKDEVEILFDGKPDWLRVSYCSNATITCPNILRLIEVKSALFYNLTISNQTVDVNLSDIFMKSCNGKRTCMVTPAIWLSNYATLNSIQLSNKSLDACMMTQYRCDVPSTYSFQFMNSTSKCLTSGYYGLLDGNINAACHSIIFNSTCDKIQINTSSLADNNDYVIRLQISDKNNRKATTFQVLELSGGEPPKLRIDCLVNCNIKTNIRTAVALAVKQVGENSVVYSNDSISYTWELFVQMEHNGTQELFENVRNLSELSATGTESIYLVLKPHSLQPGKKYHARVTGNTEFTTPGITEMEILTNLPPYSGSCKVSPLEGAAVNTTFDILCVGWKDEGLNVDRSIPISPNDYTLIYQVFYQTDPTVPQTLLSYGNKASLYGRYLPPGLPQYDFRVWIQVRVLDEYGESAITNMTVKIYEAQEVSNAMISNLTNTEILTSSAQKISQLSGSVAGILNQQASNSSNSTSANAKNVRKSIRTTLLNAIVGKINEDSELDGILQSCSTIGSITATPDEVDDVTQNTAVDVLKERTNLLFKLSSTKSSEDITESASVVAVGLQNVVMATRSQVIGDAEKTDPSTSLVDLPLFSFNPAPQRSPKIILNEEEEYLSPEEREEERHGVESQRLQVYEKNKAHARNVATKATETIFSLSDSILRLKQPGEPIATIENNGLTLETQKASAADLCKSLNNSGSTLGSILMSSQVDMLNCNAGPMSGETIETELLTLKDNPFVWDGSADNVRSSVVSLTFKYSNGSKVNTNSSTFRFDIPIDDSLSSIEPPVYTFTPTGDSQMSYHEMTILKREDVIFLTIQPLGVTTHHVKLRIYFLLTENLREFPSTTNYTLIRELPDPFVDPLHPYRLRFNGSNIDLGRYAFGIHEIDDIGNVTDPANMTLQKYEIFNFVTSCRYWNETLEQWNTNGCDVSSESNSSIVVCYCNHLTSFGAGFLVAPNPIDFASLSTKLQNIKDNLSVLLTLISIFVLYVVGLFYCRRQDKKDIQKWCVALLSDNKLCDEYFYQLTVKTGSTRNAGTHSNVYIVLGGENGNSSIRSLAESGKTKFQQGSVKKFLMAVDSSFGSLSYLRVFHNNSGKASNASWHLDNIMVTDLQTKKNFFFFCDDWLAVDESDGSIDRILPVADNQQISNFKHLFSSSTKKDFSDGHLWFSLISRPTKSRFNRVQRLSCALAVLLSTMLTSAMFFGRDETDQGQQGRLEIGPISFTVQQLLISIQASLIVFPINLLIVQLFRRVPPKDPPNDAEDNGSAYSLGSLMDVEEEEGFKNDGKNKKSGFSLPYWMIYINWCLVFIVSGVSAAFVFMYSIDWGATKSVDWLTSIVLSFIQSVFIIQPAKVVVTAVLLSVFVNRCARHRAEEIVEDEEEKEEIDDEERKRKEEEWLIQLPPETDDFTTFTNTLDKNQLRKARIAREKHKVMLETIHEVLFYLLYLILLLMAANTAKDINSYNYHNSISDIFLRQGDMEFSEVRTPDDFWSWCNNSLIPGLHASNWYNGKRVTWLQSRYLSNRETFVTGPARIRQLRVKKGSCETDSNITKVQRDCISTYSIITQETAHFMEGWRNKTTNEISVPETPWTFQDSSKLDGYPYTGLHNIYDGGGYSVTLGNTAKKSRKILKQLKDNGWVDRPTAAIFIQFTMYNANVNLFASVTLLLEGSANGAFFPFPVISPIRLYEFIDGKGLLLVTTYIIFVLVLLYKIFQICKLIKERKRKYFNNFWNCIDFLSAMMSVAASAIYGVRYIQAQITLNRIQLDVDKETFVNFQYLVLWDDIFRYLMAFILFLATIKFTRLLRFNQRIRLLSVTLAFAAKPVMLFSIMFSIYFMGFLFLANLWFEQSVYSYRNIFSGAGEMFSMLLNRFDFTGLQEADRLLGPLFFSAFTGVCTIALLNMFIVILDESIKRARVELERTHNQFEVVDYMKKQFFGYISSLMPTSNSSNKYEEEIEEEPVYIPHPEQILEKRIDELTLHVSNIEIEFYEEEEIDVDDMEAELEQLDMDEFMSDLVSVQSF